MIGSLPSQTSMLGLASEQSTKGRQQEHAGRTRPSGIAESYRRRNRKPSAGRSSAQENLFRFVSLLKKPFIGAHSVVKRCWERIFGCQTVFERKAPAIDRFR